MSFIRWIIALPLIVGAVLFALAHPDIVSVTWHPFKPPAELPLYFVALVFLGGGFLLGVIITWIGMGSLRQERRQQKKTIRKMEKNINEANEKIMELSAARIEDQEKTIQTLSHDDDND